MEEKITSLSLKTWRTKTQEKMATRAKHVHALGVRKTESVVVCVLQTAGSKTGCGWCVTHSDDWKGVWPTRSGAPPLHLPLYTSSVVHRCSWWDFKQYREASTSLFSLSTCWSLVRLVLVCFIYEEGEMTNVRCWLLWLLSPLLCSDSNGVKGDWSSFDIFFWPELLLFGFFYGVFVSPTWCANDMFSIYIVRVFVQTRKIKT